MLYYVGERTETGGLRFCLKCSKYKPDRSHHCKICNKCVLKMDHHCPWIGNCIGFNNHKYFICLVFYGFLNLTLFNFIFRDIVKFLIIEEKAVTVKLTLFVAFYFLTILLMVMMLIFNIFHFMIIINNLTTNEFLNYHKNKNQGEIAAYDIDANKLNRYDLGCWQNVKDVLGTNPLLWLIPYNSDKTKNLWNNGFNFKVNIKSEYEIIKSV